MELNRCAILLTPRQPYVDWANTVDDEGPRFELSDGHDSATVFLGPAFGTTAEIEAWVRENADQFFSSMLDDWCPEEELWPSKRTAEMFGAWFDLRIHTIVLDTLDEPLELDED